MTRHRLLSGLWRSAFAAVLVVPLVVVVYRANAARDQEVPLYGAVELADRRIEVLTVCLPSQRLRPEVRETPQTVTVTVTALSYSRANGQDCIGARGVELASPLGGRRVVDGTSGQEVDVRPGA